MSLALFTPRRETRLTKRQLDALTQAINYAAEWRGSLVGNCGDDESIEAEAKRLGAFDGCIDKMREALKVVRKMNRE